MRQLREGQKLDKLFRQVAHSSRSVLFLDYDGTLAPFREKRDEAVPYPRVPELVKAILQQKRCRTVVVTGRTVKDLIRLLGLEENLEIWGSHGREHRKPTGEYEVMEFPAEAVRDLERAREWLEENDLREHVETKPGCLALHERSMSPEEKDALFDPAARRLARFEGPSLELHQFDGGLELRIPGKSKGDAVLSVLREEGAVPAAYLGDDLTDEDAFESLDTRAFNILVRPTFRETLADLWITPPEELYDFLEKWLEAVSDPGQEQAS